MFFVLYSILSAYKKNLCILLLFNVAPFLYCRILTAGRELEERCYFRTTFMNQTHFYVSAQCWNESDVVPLKRPLILPANVSPIIHIHQTPSWKSLTSVSGRHLVTRGNRLLDNGTCVVSVDQSTSLSCISVKTVTLTIISVTVHGSSDTKCWDFPLDNTNQTDLMHLPPCIPSQSNSSFDSTVLYWNPLKNISCSGSDGIDFIPSSVYTNFSMGVFVIGNGMLYSLSNEGIYYFISFPPGIIVTNFSILEDERQYIFFTRNDSIQDSYKIWFGMTESKEVLLIYPSISLDVILNFYSITLMNISSIYWDQYNDFVMRTHSHVSIPVPLFSMFEEAVANYTLTHNPSSLFQSPQSLSPYHRLINSYTKSSSCPFASAVLQSPICTKYTRTSFLIDKNLTNQFDEYTHSYSNCFRHINELPLVVYMSRGDSFEFTVQYFLSNFDKTSLHFSLTSTPPNVIQTTLTSSWSSLTNSKLVKVRLREWLQYGEAQQVTSGETLSKTRVVLKTLGSEMFCAQEKIQEQIFIPGLFHLSVRVGCPPGLSMIYDHLESTRDQDHHCDLSDADNCLYFDNEFHPVFKLKDSVTGMNERYTGKYNLLAVAGGTSRENMVAFSQSNIESLLWTSLYEESNGTTFETSRNGIRWSKYWSIIPGTPQYYLRLKATNKGSNDSYCLFTVQFTVHIHGIAPTRIYSLIAIIIFVLLFLSTFIVGFGIWLNKDKVKRRQ